MIANDENKKRKIKNGFENFAKDTLAENQCKV